MLSFKFLLFKSYHFDINFLFVKGLPVYLTLLGASLLTQGCLITILYVGRFHFTQLIEVSRVILTILKASNLKQSDFKVIRIVHMELIYLNRDVNS